MEKLLKSLLNDLEAIGDEHEEVYDTDVREQMWEAVRRAFVVPETGYRLPADFGMFSAEGNGVVRTALESFLSKAPDAARAAGLLTPAARMNAFQNPSIVTSGQSQAYDAFFGHSDVP